MYIQLDDDLRQRKDITPATKLVIGYINARQGIDGINWDYCPTEIAKQLGLNLGGVIKILDKIIERKLLPLKFIGWKRSPKTTMTYKIYRIVATTPGVTIDQNKKPEAITRMYKPVISTRLSTRENNVKDLEKLDKDYEAGKIGKSMYQERRRLLLYQ